MKTTLEIDDDVLAAVDAIARSQGRPVDAVVSALLRQALHGIEATLPATNGSVPQVEGTGFRPFASRGQAVTCDVIDVLRDREGA